MHHSIFCIFLFRNATYNHKTPIPAQFVQFLNTKLIWFLIDYNDAINLRLAFMMCLTNSTLFSNSTPLYHLKPGHLYGNSLHKSKSRMVSQVCECTSTKSGWYNQLHEQVSGLTVKLTLDLAHAQPTWTAWLRIHRTFTENYREPYT